MSLIFFGKGLRDVSASLSLIKLPAYLAYCDIRQRYRRSSLGPFWITISMGITIACIGVIFGNLFKSPMEEFFPFLTIGLILWGFISTVLTESTTVFPSSEGIIRQLPIPLFSHILRMIIRNLNILAHNMFVVPVVYICVGKGVNWDILFFIPGFVLLLINLGWMSLFLAIVCARFRDLTQIMASVLQIFFYVTPIIWMPNLLPARSAMMLLEPNPFYQLLTIVRDPLLGCPPSISSYVYTLTLAFLGWIITIVFFNKYRDRIAYWL
ncbi:ABC transporter permease [Turicimonas muris]|uniref:ABC transporter permease n=1 Tax=Turicimonas muris TaxID=1796652 RepID=UPI00248A963F|nr:ABC transporter permease [Turicimonas muris]MBS4768422.1 ABC transporter permease [Burkholderiales bacterium]